ncbi:hypothetical protein TUM4261_06950 [Shewanella sp. c952]|uniref:hypothetical protein n=1 Tax=Shewanella sp. c952 TaxID=2815913 RepID=UPI001BC1043B|nr:hypothetical protein [Shewanella sp. c952]GIU05298.1 hypothetical protein TUM4261_06950 [Shewanella sp. c952]
MDKYRKFIFCSTLDLKTPFYLSRVFFLLTLIVATFAYYCNDCIPGLNLIEFVGSIMTEHEAGISMAILSVVALFCGVIKLYCFKADNKSIDLKVINPVTNFLLSLVFVEIGITLGTTIATFIALPTETITLNIFWGMLFYLSIKNVLLASTLVAGLILLNCKAKEKYKKRHSIFILVLLSSIHLCVFNYWHLIEVL